YLDALVTLAGLYFTQAKLDEAISISQRAIDFDLGCEPAYQTSMQAYARLNDRVNVKRMYQACVDAMKSQFNLPPSKETEELYQRLIK
ncbi:MAG: bacterial transcriptional activator domain-containing protein, partial [Pseudomonadales bacterium]|nr:bacterial transcriptional activator domain-containing protein [Pseudomonadales bacterium]